MSYIDANDLVFMNDKINGIHTGGFSVNSIMMKKGISPIMTINNEQTGGSNLVSDIFNNLVVPNWALSYNMAGGKYKDSDSDSDSDSDNDSDIDEDDVIDDDLHDKLLDLVKQHDIKSKQNNKKNTKKQKGASKKSRNTKKIRNKK